MLPADQGLDPVDLAGVQVDDRLVVEDELAAGERVLQIRLDLEELHGAFVHRRLEDGVPVLPGGLGRVHRRVRVADEVVRSDVRLGRQRDAGARPDEDLAATDLEHRSERLLEPRRQLDRGDLGDRILEQDGELVAAQARDRVARATAGGDAASTSTSSSSPAS